MITSLCWYGSKDHHFILLPGHILYRKPGGHKIFLNLTPAQTILWPQASCIGCDPAAIWNGDPWTHTNIMILSNLLFLFSWVNFRSFRPKLHSMDVRHKLPERQTGEQYQPLRCGAGESCLHREISSPMNTYTPSLANTHH